MERGGWGEEGGHVHHLDGAGANLGTLVWVLRVVEGVVGGLGEVVEEEGFHLERGDAWAALTDSVDEVGVGVEEGGVDAALGAVEAVCARVDCRAVSGGLAAIEETLVCTGTVGCQRGNKGIVHLGVTVELERSTVQSAVSTRTLAQGINSQAW